MSNSGPISIHKMIKLLVVFLLVLSPLGAAFYSGDSHALSESEKLEPLIIFSPVEIETLNKLSPKVAETLIVFYPDKKEYWRQLWQIHAFKEENQKALSIIELAYVKGFVDKNSDIENLAKLYSFNKLPFKAAMTLEKHIKSGEVKKTETNLKDLANYFFEAKELLKSAEYFGEAAEISSDPALYQRQGDMLFQMGEFPQAEIALKKVIAKNENMKLEVSLTLVLAYLYQKKFRESYHQIEEASDALKPAIAEDKEAMQNKFSQSLIANILDPKKSPEIYMYAMRRRNSQETQLQLLTDKYSQVKSIIESWKLYIVDKAMRNGVML